MDKHVLSKSTFIRGVQCLKSLYLNKKRPFLRDRLPKERLLVFQRGHKVGEFAHQLFPGGINMSPGHPAAYRKALINTREKIAEGSPVIYEAAFQHEGVLIFLDILVNNGNGWHAYEVKSSGGISDTYLMDAALQYYVIRGTGIALTGIALIHIDKEYIKDGDIDPKGLFKIVDVTDEAISRQEFVREQIIREKEALNLSSSPKINVGKHCREPYDCDFIGHCWKNEPVPPEKNRLDHINKASVPALIGNRATISFLKLLTMRQAIPAYDGTHPYQEIPYGFSLTVNGNTIFKILGHHSNPAPGIKEELHKKLANIDSVVTFGQGHICGSILPENASIIDLMDAVSTDSELRNNIDGESLLAKVFSVSGSGMTGSAYTSDAVCTHYYLEDFDSAEVKASIEKYARAWVEGIEGLYELIKNS
jgi:hypothetical protein